MISLATWIRLAVCRFHDWLLIGMFPFSMESAIISRVLAFSPRRRIIAENERKRRRKKKKHPEKKERIEQEEKDGAIYVLVQFAPPLKRTGFLCSTCRGKKRRNWLWDGWARSCKLGSAHRQIISGINHVESHV